MKTKLAGLIALLVLGTQWQVLAYNRPETVNQKLLKAFQATFPSAEKVAWNEDADHYVVTFKDHQVLSEITYDREGNFIASERYYTDQSQLPLHLAWELHNKYRNKSIYCIIETNTEAETYYYVKLQDAKEWLTIQGSADGIIAIIERFNKQV